MTFEFGETEQSKTFLSTNPDFQPAFEALLRLANSCFGRPFAPKNRQDDVCFNLGQACRDDYLEIVFLVVHGYGNGTSKLLRGLYERAVTLAYILEHPAKAERFVRYGAIQEYKALVAALKVVTEEEFDEAMKATTSAAQIRQVWSEIKPEFEVTACKCGRKTTAFSWDVDFASMVHNLGDPYDKYYLGSYTVPNLHVHATLASTFQGSDLEKKPELSRRSAAFALTSATALLILVITSENKLFKLNLDDTIKACDEHWQRVCYKLLHGYGNVQTT